MKHKYRIYSSSFDMTKDYESNKVYQWNEIITVNGFSWIILEVIF